MFEKFMVLKNFTVPFHFEAGVGVGGVSVQRIISLKKPVVCKFVERSKVQKKLLQRYNIYIALLAKKLLHEHRFGKPVHGDNYVVAGGRHIVKCYWRPEQVSFAWSRMPADKVMEYKKHLAWRKTK